MENLDTEVFEVSFLKNNDNWSSMKFVSESELLLFISRYDSSSCTSEFKSFSFDIRRKTFTNLQPVDKVPEETKAFPDGSLITLSLPNNPLLILDSKSRHLVNKINKFIQFEFIFILYT